MLKALLATGRTSNLPTVWSNVLVAFLLVSGGNELHITSLLVAAVAASLIYIGGCFLGDAIDSGFDALHKPTRPIPSGILDRSIVCTTATLLLAAGTLIPWLYFQKTQLLIPSSLLTAAVVLYSWLHKKSLFFGLPLIGACRFLLLPFGAAIAIAHHGFLADPFSPTLLTAAAAIALYTICFASVARTESSQNPFNYRNTIALIMALTPTLFLAYALSDAVLNPSNHLRSLPYLPVVIALLNYWIWFAASLSNLKHNRKGPFVAMSLAGFCLLDATIAALFGWPYLSIALILFILALLLQKITPAT